MSNTTTRKARTSNDTPSREEVTAVSTLTATAVATFVANAGTVNGLTFGEARDYVAAVDAHGKRGGAAAVQRAIADAVTAAGYEPLSQSRYSKLADAYRALAGIGLDVDADSFRITYGLWNLSSALLTASDRDAIVETAKRKRTVENKMKFLSAELEAARQGKRKPVVEPEEPPVETTGDDGSADGSADGSVVLAVGADADAVLDAIAELFAVAQGMADADRIRIADAFRHSADALLDAAVPADASELAAA